MMTPTTDSTGRVGTMSGTESAAPAAAKADGPVGPGPTAPKAHKSRATVAVVLVVIASILLPAGVVRNMILNTDRYVSTVSPLASDPAVQNAMVERVTTAVVSGLDLQQRAEAALPERAKFLAGPIAAGGQQLVDVATTKVVESTAFRTLWDTVNRRAHDQIVLALTGRRTGALTNADGKVVLDLSVVAQNVAEELHEIAPGVPTNIDFKRLNTRFVLVDSSDLAAVQDYVKLLDRLAWIVPILALLMYGAAIAVAPNRRRGVVWVGLGIFSAMAVMLIGYNFGRTQYLDHLPAGAHPDAAAVVFDTLTRFFERALRTVLVVGLLVALIAWLAGPARGAQAIRRQWNRLSSKGAGEEPGEVSQWVGRSATGLRIGLLVLLVFVLFVWPKPTGLVVLGLAVVGVIGLAAIQLIGAGATPEAVDRVGDEPATDDDGSSDEPTPEPVG
jgi:hypothetical protein